MLLLLYNKIICINVCIHRIILHTYIFCNIDSISTIKGGVMMVEQLYTCEMCECVHHKKQKIFHF